MKPDLLRRPAHREALGQGGPREARHVALALGSVSSNLGAGLTNGRVYLLEPDGSRLNQQYVKMEPLDDPDAAEVQQLLREHAAETASRTAERLLRSFDKERFARVVTAIVREPIE